MEECQKPLVFFCKTRMGGSPKAALAKRTRRLFRPVPITQTEEYLGILTFWNRNSRSRAGSSFQLFPVFLCINIWHHFIVIHSFCLYSGYILKLILLFYNFSFVISCFSVLLTGTYKYFFISHFLFFEFYELTLQNIFHILSQQPCCLSALSTQASQKQLDRNAWPVSSGCDCGRMLESLNILFLSQAGAARKRL